MDANPRAQLGRGVHNFGHKSPYTNISSQLGWSVYNFAHKLNPCKKKIPPYKDLTRQLGWDVSYYGPNNPIYKHYIKLIRLGCSLRWTKTL